MVLSIKTKIGHYSDICVVFIQEKFSALGDEQLQPIMRCAKKLELYQIMVLKKYEHIYAGMNSRLDPLQASFLNLRLQDLNLHNSMRVQLAQTYDQKITNQRLLNQNFPKILHGIFIFTQRRDKNY